MPGLPGAFLGPPWVPPGRPRSQPPGFNSCLQRKDGFWRPGDRQGSKGRRRCRCRCCCCCCCCRCCCCCCCCCCRCCCCCNQMIQLSTGTAFQTDESSTGMSSDPRGPRMRENTLARASVQMRSRQQWRQPIHDNNSSCRAIAMVIESAQVKQEREHRARVVPEALEIAGGIGNRQQQYPYCRGGGGPVTCIARQWALALPSWRCHRQ